LIYFVSVAKFISSSPRLLFKMSDFSSEKLQKIQTEIASAKYGHQYSWWECSIFISVKNIFWI